MSLDLFFCWLARFGSEANRGTIFFCIVVSKHDGLSLTFFVKFGLAFRLWGDPSAFQRAELRQRPRWLALV